MAVAAITDNYTGERLDRVENFHGNQVLYVAWDHHTMICAPVAFAVPPDMPFGNVVEELLPGAYSQHPQYGEIDWSAVQWYRNGTSFIPDPAASLEDQGIDHKSIIRFATPGLDGIGGSGS